VSDLRYRATLFDLDGTLVDSGQDLVGSVQYAFKTVFPEQDVPEPDDILAQVGKPLETMARELGGQLDAGKTQQFVDTYRAHYAEHFQEHTQVFPGVSELLAQLKAAGVRLAVVTTKHQTQAEFTLTGLELAKYFDYIHGWQEGREHKPHPEPVLTVLSRLGLEPAAALMVGDSELDIQAGRAAGTATCAVTYGFRPAWFLHAFGPDFLVSEASDILAVVVGSAGMDGP